MKKLITLIAVGLFSSVTIAQTFRCGTDEAMKEAMANDPTLKARLEAADAERKRITSNLKNKQRIRGTRAAFTFDTIPVVFHIVHEYGPENIPDQTCIDALAQVNLDYRKGDSDTGSIRLAFKGLATAGNLVFKLANKDPNGNCTNGIMRHYDVKRTYWNRNLGSTALTANYAYNWPASKYLNIYIIKDIVADPASTGGGTVVGYTYRPGTWGTNDVHDCIVYNYGFLSGREARSLSHEVGHWLGLAHTFGSTNSPGTCGDDFLNDTPETTGFYSTCPLGSTSATTCNGVEENIQNIMDYSSCPSMFTQDQMDEVRSTLLSTTSGRSTLVSNTNMINSGLWRNPAVSCAPTAEFLPFAYKTICAGGSVNFNDISFGGPITSRSWTFTGGTPATDTSKNVTVTYAAEGVYNVSLTETGPGGSTGKTKTGKIIVLPASTTLTPLYSQDFENATTIANEIVVVNQEDDAILWKRATNAGAGGTSSFTLNNFSSTQVPNHTDQFILPAVNLAGYTGITISFKYAYRTKNSVSTDATMDSKDQLRVLISSSCGAAWAPRLSMNGTALASVTGDLTTSFNPGYTATNWKTKTITIPTSLALNNTRIMFELKANFGNNIYIDNVNIDGVLGFNPLTINSAKHLSVAPNPFENSTQVNFGLDNASEHVKVSITNLIGQEIKILHNGYLEGGENEFTISKNDIPSAGVYFVKVNVEGAEQVQKIINY